MDARVTEGGADGGGVRDLSDVHDVSDTHNRFLKMELGLGKFENGRAGNRDTTRCDGMKSITRSMSRFSSVRLVNVPPHICLSSILEPYGR